MKGRPKNLRKISAIPTIRGFRPFGNNLTNDPGNKVVLFYEEYEALRLNDYDHMMHEEAAEVMQVSRPTLTRIYMSAREKIAKALVEGLRIEVVGGNSELDGVWYECHDCKCLFSYENEDSCRCALCGSENIAPYSLQQEHKKNQE